MPENIQVNNAQVGSIDFGSGFWIRALARLLDLIFALVLGFFAGIFAGVILAILAVFQIIGQNWQQEISGTSSIALALSLLGSFIYEVTCEGFYGATLGKLICRLHVLSEDGNPCGLKGAIIRNLAFYIDALFFGLVAYSSMSKTPLKQRYGDRWGKTVVVQIQQLPNTSKRSGGRFLLVFAIGASIWSALIVFSLILEVL